MEYIEKEELYPMLFEPVYKSIMWGGKLMKSELGRKTPADKQPVAESWEITDRKDGISKLENGAMKGASLRELIEHYGKSLLGKKFKGDRFPLLVKIIDAGKRLSLQVHPDEKTCCTLKNGAEPKTEMWYVISAEKNAKIIAGLNPSCTQNEFKEKMSTADLEECLQVFKSSPGDAYFIKSGRIHAIGAGNLLLEIQQNSNTTYRVSDWGRVGNDGKPRELHIDNALKSIDFMDRTSPKIPGASDKTERNRKYPIVNKCRYFNVDELRLKEKWLDNTQITKSFHLVSVMNNSVIVGNDDVKLKLEKGRTCLIPACFGQYHILPESKNEIRVLRTSL